MMGLLDKITGSIENRELKKYKVVAQKVTALEEEYAALTDEQLKDKTLQFKKRLAEGQSLEDILPEAFAAASQAAWRTVKMKPFPVQIMGAAVLHEGNIAEMKTGEGKTLAATMPAYLNALTGKGVHIITVNDYLASRDSRWMGQIYEFLGLSVGLNVHGMNPAEKRAAYNADITYGTNNEFGFDYLRDNMVKSRDNLVMRELNYAIIDEVDSILIDEARTPLIISGSSKDSSRLYSQADQFVARLRKETDYTIEEKDRTISLTEEGTAKTEKYFNIENLSDLSNIALRHHVNQALKARYIMKKDVDYVVREGEVIIVDEFTGRLMPGRRYNEGLHQAIEAKEKVKVAGESVTMATITFQNFFRLYNKISGMTGTAKTEEREFESIYGMKVICIPTNKPMIRQDLNDQVYKTEKAKFNAVIEEIKKRHATGQPLLVGTISIEKSEVLSKMLKREGIVHNVLNAKNHEKEAEIVAQAGQRDTVTISTNMAGRGTDIVLGEGVARLGGLHIIGTERHESRRIDNQLRGRAGRQGDAGSSQFFISLEDDLMKMFGSERTLAIANKLGVEDDMPLEANILSKGIENAQKNVEGRNFGSRKYVLQYDDVMNKQREVIYAQRRTVLEGQDISEKINEMIRDVCAGYVHNQLAFTHEDSSPDMEKLEEKFRKEFSVEIKFPLSQDNNALTEIAYEAMMEKRSEREELISHEMMRDIERIILLTVVDNKWMDHIDNMDQLRQGIGLRAYGQQDPVQAYTQEGFEMFEAMNEAIIEETVRVLYNFKLTSAPAPDDSKVPTVSEGGPAVNNTVTKKYVPSPGEKPIAKNAKCPCGSGKKYKQCCGKGLFNN
ncbi:MAG: preprotein translocase subunit SecA [Eubacteriaceae bacterium]|nr:preprotein translocase subunit SecA [Eubacteriaceae bacterium]